MLPCRTISNTMAMSDTTSNVTDADSKINCQRSASNTIAHSCYKRLAKVARRCREVPPGRLRSTPARVRQQSAA
jgi:hypothetical protein